MGHFAGERHTVRTVCCASARSTKPAYEPIGTEHESTPDWGAGTQEFRPRDQQKRFGLTKRQATPAPREASEDLGTKMCLHQFPPELLATIFGYLSEYEIKAASDVNTRWRVIAANLVLVPRGHLLLNHPPESVWTPFHTVHIDGTQRVQHLFNQVLCHLNEINTVVLYGVWTHQRLTELSQCLEHLPAMTTLEISGASPLNFILDFLLIRHNITKIRCFLDENQTKSYRRSCERLKTTHGLFEEVILTLKTKKGVEVYVPKSKSLNFPGVDSTTNLTIHPARLPNLGFEKLCQLDQLESLTLNYPRNMPADLLTQLPPSLKKLVLHNAKTVSHDSWANFFNSPVVNSLEELYISGQNQIDSSIFDNLQRNPNLRKLYLQMHCPCYADQCGIESILSWSPNIEVLVLHVPFSSVGVFDLVNLNKELVGKLHTLKVLFQLTPDMVEPYNNMDYSEEKIVDKVCARLPRASVKIEFKTHLREFVCDDDDDFE